jgi:hypothetical protein
MGLSPDQILGLPLHDYQAAIHHFNRANSSVEEDDDAPLSDSDFDEMMVAMAGQSGGIH